MLPNSANMPSAALAKVFGQSFATQLVASRRSGSPSSSPAKTARRAPNEPTTGPPKTRRRPCEPYGTSHTMPTEPKVLFQTGAADPDYQAAIAVDEETGEETGEELGEIPRPIARAPP